MNLLSGNEAIARGAWEAGCHIGAAYPGTPSTETMESFAKLPGVYAEWCPNEKVALEVAVGASAAGARVLVTMKHVGVNVCADPLFTAAYTGVNGGLVILAADDPGMFSSQNEQDSLLRNGLHGPNFGTRRFSGSASICERCLWHFRTIRYTCNDEVYCPHLSHQNSSRGRGAI